MLTSNKIGSAPSKPVSMKTGLLLVGCLVLSTLAFSQYRNIILLLGCEVVERDFGGGSG